LGKHDQTSPNTSPSTTLSERPAIDLPQPLWAFKEWALICRSIFRGNTSLIFRKGGLAEGKAGFSFRFDSFFLYPTFFHAQAERLTSVPETDRQAEETDPVLIHGFVRLEVVRFLNDLTALEKIENLHLLKADVLKERFAYGDRLGLFVGFIRAFRLVQPWPVPFERSFGGCRSWIQLPNPPPDLQAAPALSDSAQAARRAMVDEALG
jgi:hypothetical protein